MAHHEPMVRTVVAVADPVFEPAAADPFDATVPGSAPRVHQGAPRLPDSVATTTTDDCAAYDVGASRPELSRLLATADLNTPCVRIEVEQALSGRVLAAAVVALGDLPLTDSARLMLPVRTDEGEQVGVMCVVLQGSSSLRALLAL
jgi:hypothetical protein